MNVRYLSIPVMIALITVPLMHYDVVSADEMRFGVYETGSRPESVYSGPLIDRTVDFEITDDLKLRLPEGTELSSSKAYMRLDSGTDIPYRVDVKVSGLDGFVADSGLIFEFHESEDCSDTGKRISVTGGTTATDTSFVSNRNYFIRIVTGSEVILDEVPERIDGIRISLDVTADDIGFDTVEDAPDSDGMNTFTPGYLRKMMDDDNGILAFNVDGYGLIFDSKASSYIMGRTESCLEMHVMRTADKEGDTDVLETSVVSDGVRLSTLGGGTLRISAPYPSGGVSDVRVSSVSSDGSTEECTSVFNTDSGKVDIISGSCCAFALEPVREKVSDEKGSDVDPALIVIPIAAISGLILLTIVLRRGRN